MNFKISVVYVKYMKNCHKQESKNCYQFSPLTYKFHILTNSNPNFSLLKVVNVRKWPEKSCVNPSSGIEQMFPLKSRMFEVFHFSCKKKYFFLCFSRHCPLCDLAQYCSAHKKSTL